MIFINRCKTIWCGKKSSWIIKVANGNEIHNTELAFGLLWRNHQCITAAGIQFSIKKLFINVNTKTSKIKRFYRFINRILLHRTMALPYADFMNTLCLLSLMFANKTLRESYRINLFIPLFPRCRYLRDTEKFTEKYHIFIITWICF